MILTPTEIEQINAGRPAWSWFDLNDTLAKVIRSHEALRAELERTRALLADAKERREKRW